MFARWPALRGGGTIGRLRSAWITRRSGQSYREHGNVRFVTGTPESAGRRGVARSRQVGRDMASGRQQLTAGNLPVELSSFVGRGRELAEVRRLLSVAHAITLT